MKQSGFCVFYGNGSVVCDDPCPPDQDCQLIIEYFPDHRHVTMGHDVYELPFLDYPLYGRYMPDDAFDALVERVMAEDE